MARLILEEAGYEVKFCFLFGRFFFTIPFGRLGCFVLCIFWKTYLVVVDVFGGRYWFKCMDVSWRMFLKMDREMNANEYDWMDSKKLVD